MMRLSELPKYKQDEIKARAKQAGDPDPEFNPVIRIIFMTIFILVWFATLAALLFLA